MYARYLLRSFRVTRAAGCVIFRYSGAEWAVWAWARHSHLQYFTGWLRPGAAIILRDSAATTCSQIHRPLSYTCLSWVSGGAHLGAFDLSAIEEPYR